MQIVVTQPRPMLALYHSDGLTWITNLTTAKQLKWRDPYSDFGSISFAIAESDAAELTANRIVKVFWKGRARIAARLKKHTTEFAVDDVAYRGYDTIPGVLLMWNDAIVWPEYPLSQRTTGSQRVFGAMSNFLNHADSSWYEPADWHRAQGVPWSDTPGAKHRKPDGLSGPDPWWIARTYPFPSESAAATQWFRRNFTVYKGFAYTIYATADNYLTLYLDGEQIITPDQQNGQTWRGLVAVSGIIQPGKHLLAAKVQNAYIKHGYNPVGLILAMIQMGGNGQPIKGRPFLKTDSSWLVTDVRQGWHRSLVPRSLHAEAVARDVSGPVNLGLTWTGDRDSAGVAWTDQGEWIFDIASAGLADIALQQAEKTFDLHVNADRMTVGAYKRLGTDKTATVQLQLGKDGGSLISYQPTRDPTKFTSALLHLNDGAWQHFTASDADGFIVEVGVSLGSTSDTDTASEVVDQAFQVNAHELVSVNVESSCYTGPQPYQHFSPGDTITIPSPAGAGTIAGRVLAIMVDCSGLEDPSDGKIHCYPEFTLDGSV